MAECCYAECHYFWMYKPFILSIIMLNVDMLNVAAPLWLIVNYDPRKFYYIVPRPTLLSTLGVILAKRDATSPIE
jgi:hypothetical protein